MKDPRIRFDLHRRRRGPWLLRAALLLLPALLPLLFWLQHRHTNDNAGRGVVQAENPSPSAAELAASDAFSVQATLPAPPSARAALPAMAAASAMPAAAAPRTVADLGLALSGNRPLRMTVCGMGEVWSSDVERLYPQPVIDEARQRLIGALLGGSEREQVAGWLLAQPKDEPLPTASVDALVALAERSADPAVYRAVAAHACLLHPPRMSTLLGRHACTRLSPAGWQQRDPGNATPWLWQAAIAAEDRRADAVEAALDEAARRRFVDVGVAAALEPLVRHPLYLGLPPVLRNGVALAAQSQSMSTGSMVSQIQVVTHHCTPALLHERAGPLPSAHTGALQGRRYPSEPARRTRCESIARLWSGDRATQLEQRMAFRLGERLGWPAGELQVMEREINRTQRSLTHTAIAAALYDCTAMNSFHAYWQDAAVSGEAGALRSLADRTEVPADTSDTAPAPRTTVPPR